VTTWTLPKLREARRRQHEGETLQSIADDYGVTRNALNGALYRHLPGSGPGRFRRNRPGDRERDKMAREAIKLKAEGYTYPELVGLLGYPHSAAGLKQLVRRYKKRAGFET